MHYRCYTTLACPDSSSQSSYPAWFDCACKGPSARDQTLESPSESAGSGISRRGPVGKLALYATPPATPTAHRTSAFDTPLGELKFGRIGGMEGDEQHRRQYEQPSYPQRGYVQDLRPGAQGSNVPEAHDLRDSAGSDGTDRLRQSQLLAARTPTSGSMAVGGGNPQLLGGFGYTQGQQYSPTHMQGSSLQYQTDYSPETQRQQQFPQYASQLMYSVPQQAQQQSPYEPVPQYQPRQSAALEVLSTQFGVPQFYNPGEVGVWYCAGCWNCVGALREVT